MLLLGPSPLGLLLAGCEFSCSYYSFGFKELVVQYSIILAYLGRYQPVGKEHSEVGEQCRTAYQRAPSGG